jgi:hypothetical protein
VADTSEGPNEQVLISLISARTQEEGGLVWRVAKGPSEPRQLTLQQQREVHVWLKMGEPHATIAYAYGVNIDTIRQLAQ